MNTHVEAPQDPNAVLEALVSAWAELLVADYRARHPNDGASAVEDSLKAYDPNGTEANHVDHRCDLRAKEY